MKLFSPHPKKGRNALVVCNGEVLSKKEIAPFMRGNPFVVCADGGADKARKLRIRPDVIIGDLDSISPAARKFFSDVRTIHVKSQDNTDLEKVLAYLVMRRYRSAIVVGALGGRPDHSLTNFSVLKKYHKRIRLVFADSSCDIQIIDRRITFSSGIGSVISLLPLGRCEGITTAGLEFPLHNESLELGVREGMSNTVVSSPVKISVRKGSLLLFMVKPK